jgi:hypothetical protein
MRNSSNLLNRERNSIWNTCRGFFPAARTWCVYIILFSFSFLYWSKLYLLLLSYFFSLFFFFPSFYSISSYNSVLFQGITPCRNSSVGMTMPEFLNLISRGKILALGGGGELTQHLTKSLSIKIRLYHNSYILYKNTISTHCIITHFSKL